MTDPKPRARRRWTPPVVASVATGGTVERAAELGGVSARTINRWKTLPAFRKDVEQFRGSMLEATIGTVSGLAIGALTTLDEIRRNPEAPAAARVSACRCMLETLLRAREHGTLSDRLAALEDALTSGLPQALPAGWERSR